MNKYDENGFRTGYWEEENDYFRILESGNYILSKKDGVWYSRSLISGNLLNKKEYKHNNILYFIEYFIEKTYYYNINSGLIHIHCDYE